MSVVTRVQHTHRDYLPWLVLLVQHRIVYDSFLYLLKVQANTWGLGLLLPRVLRPCWSMATFTCICPLTALSLHLLLMRRRCDPWLNFCLCASRTYKLFCKLIGGSIPSKDCLMKLGSIVSAFIVFSNNWSIVTVSRFRPDVFSWCVDSSLIQ